MRKFFLLFTCQFFLISMALMAQNTDATGNLPASKFAQSKMIYYAIHPREDKSDIIEITGIGNTSFSVVNQVDESIGAGDMAYIYSETIVVSLITNAKDMNYQLVFYSDKENFNKIITRDGALTSVYFPKSMYNDIKQKLDQAISQKKKAQLKLEQKTKGYNGATLLF